MTRTALRICPLCEATCGLALTMDGDRVAEVRGDADDVFSEGYLCPKGVALADFHADPDHLHRPLIKRDGRHEEASWEEAFAEIARRLPPIIDAHGRDAVGLYAGNPNVHNLAGQLYLPALARALGSRNIFTASTADQMPKHVTGGLMFGDKLSIAVPDVDRTDFFLILGADPLSSNGSLFTAADLPGRLRALRKRGGRLVVVDPRRSRTAEIADTHLFIRPGTDALFLFALVEALYAEGLADLGDLAGHVNGVDQVAELAKGFPAEAVADHCGIPAATIRQLARDLAAAGRAVVYGRIGTCTQRFGTLASWLVDVLNVVTGNFDREGGAMFPLAPGAQRNAGGGDGREVRFGRWRSRVRGLAEVFSELPVSCLAEEIDTPGEGQIRALITVAGNPALSAPDAGRLDRAMGELDFMVSVDAYLNETTRHADVVLPVPSPLRRSHMDFAFAQLAVRNTARYSPAALPLEDGQPSEDAILLRLAAIAAGQGAEADVDALDDLMAYTVAQREVAAPASRLTGRDPAEVVAESAPLRGPERLIDIVLRSGPYGLTLADVRAAPHGIDLGPLRPRVPEVLRTPSRKIELAPEPIVEDVPRLHAELAGPPAGMMLIGRRHLRSNNSWMHNLTRLNSGTNRCTALVHPDDAARLGLEDGALATVRSRTGAIDVPVEISDAMMPGVVSIPHGWGHQADGIRMDVAAGRAGVNLNLLTDPEEVDPISGNAVFNGIPVSVSPATVVTVPDEPLPAPAVR